MAVIVYYIVKRDRNGDFMIGFHPLSPEIILYLNIGKRNRPDRVIIITDSGLVTTRACHQHAKQQASNAK